MPACVSSMRLGGSRRGLCLRGTLGLPPSLLNSMEALTKREGGRHNRDAKEIKTIRKVVPSDSDSEPRTGKSNPGWRWSPPLPNSSAAIAERVPRELFLGRLLARGLLPARPHRRRVSAQPGAWRELVLPLLFSLSLSPDLLKHDSNVLEAGGTLMK